MEPPPISKPLSTYKFNLKDWLIPNFGEYFDLVLPFEKILPLLELFVHEPMSISLKYSLLPESNTYILGEYDIFCPNAIQYALR